MQNSNSLPWMDWLAISFRWLVLMAFSSALLVQGSDSRWISFVLLAGGIWNLALTVLVLKDKSLNTYRLLIVGVDLLIANLTFYLSGWLKGPLGWSGMLPVLTAGLFFETGGTLVTLLLCLLSLGTQAFFFTTPLLASIYLATTGFLYLGFGLLVGFLRGRASKAYLGIQKERQKTIEAADRIESDRRRAIYKLLSALSATLNYERVLDTALDMCTTALSSPDVPPEHLVSAVLLFAAGERSKTPLRVGSARRFTPADLRVGLPGTSGLIGRAINDGEAHLSENIATDPELRRFVTLRACQVAFCVPLRSGLDAFGVMVFAHPNPDYFTSDRREVLETIGNQAVIAIQNARLYRDLELEKERVMEIQEESRIKLARDLHDGPTQSVAALAMRINFGRRMMQRDTQAAADELTKAEELARRTVKEIRHMLFTLRPLVLESQGLTAALESMAEKMNETWNQNVIVSTDPQIIQELEIGKQTVVFYIAEEAVNNARKHAGAEHIWVRIKALEADLALLEIEDDGAGFDTGAVEAGYEARGSLGMVNMRERAELVNGLLNVDSANKRGTRVQLVIPLTEKAAARIHRRL